MTSGAPRQASPPRVAGAALLVCLGLAVIHTWPLSSAPWRLSLNYHADAELNAWIVTWVAHALPVSPAQLFNANIFWPETSTLTYSEPLIVPALLVAPIHWLGGSPVLAFNVLTMAGLALTAWSAWFVAWRWTGSATAAIVAGALAAFNVHVLTRLAHPAATHAWSLPLAWYLADDLIDRPRARTVVLLAAAIAATAATSLYLLAFVALIVGLVTIVGARTPRSLGSAAGAVGLGFVFALPVLWPYLRVAAAGTTRPLEMVAQFSASPAGYLASTSRIDGLWTRGFFTNDVDVFFGGVAALLLAVVGFVHALRLDARTRRRALTLVVVACVGVVLSLGPSTPIYRALYAWVLPLRGLRAAARFGYLYLLAVAMLAAWGVAAIAAWRGTPSHRMLAITAIALALVTIEAWQGPRRTVAFARVPAIYDLLASEPDPVRLVEVPFYPPDAVFENAEYVFNSTAHWRPLMNGYSGYTPDSYRRRTESFWYFPEAWALESIKREGATHLMVHLSRFTPDEAAQIARVMLERRDFTLVASDPFGNRLYAITPGR